MAKTGERELLIYDPTIASGQTFAMTTRQAPPIKPTQVDLDKNYGTFYVQDVYSGPTMTGIKRGTVKKLRVIGLDGRAAATTQMILHPVGGRSTSAVAINNGTYDIKHVLGTVDVEDDGSVCFKVPVRTPMFFQLLDEKGYVVQAMRSWTVMQPGEMLSCVGCHEDKNTSFIGTSSATQASRKAPKGLTPFFKPGEEPVQEWVNYMTEGEKKAYHYLGINAPQNEDVPMGFSYRREVQPVWDKHCIQCHTGTKNPDKNDAPMSLLGDSGKYDMEYLIKHVKWQGTWRDLRKGGNAFHPGRDFSESYLNLTKYGFDDELVNFMKACGIPEIIPPYPNGAHNSKLMEYMEASHYGVQVSDEEKRRVACWIDLLVPYCGGWLEANTWDEWKNPFYHRNGDQLRGVYLFNETKRLKEAEVEVDHLEKYKEYLETGKQFSLQDFAVMTFGGWETQKKFLADFKVRDSKAPIVGASTGNLALNPSAATHQIRSYPHATSNSHHKYRAEFSPKNLIDGNKSPDSPFWKPDPRTDLWVKVEFGREVSVEKTVIYLKKFPDAQKTWTSATLVFSDGSKIPIDLKFTDEPQEFTFPAKKTNFVQLTDLKESFPLGVNGITEWEIYGRD
jgi:hypothetical protein